MVNNFWKIVFRSMWRYKGYTLLNIVGMAIGTAALVWGFQTYRFSLSFDNFHKDRNNIYRALSYKEGANGVKGIFPMAAVKQAQHDFSGIQEGVRFLSRGLSIRYDKNEPFAEQAYFTDPEFFDLFNFPLVVGSNNIDDKSAVLITESTAKKYFGSKDPVGRSLVFYSGDSYALPLTVTGVLKDVPINSTIQFDFITNFENFRRGNGSKVAPDDWTLMMDAAFFKIADPAVAKRLAKEFDKYISIQRKAREDWKTAGFKLISLSENAAMSGLSNNNLSERPEDSATYGPFILAILIFLSACLNFSNTTVSRASRRLKEMGIRKVMGSSQRHLIFQMLMECGFVVVLAALLSTLFNYWWLPAFNQMFNGVKVTANYLSDINLLLFIVAAIVSATLLAGGYPAFYISRFNPSTIFHGTVKFGGKNLFSRIMLGLQVSIAMITVIAGIGFARNAEFQKNYDYGYNIENTIGVVVFDTTSFSAFRNEIAAMPQVTAFAGTRNHIGYGSRNVVAEAEGTKGESNFLEVGVEYVETMNLKMAVGRGFDAHLEGDYSQSILITQNQAANFGWKDKEALGKRIFIDSMHYTVIGVLKDFQFDQLFDPPEPVVMRLGKENRYQFLVIQSKGSDLETVFAKTKDAWKKVFPMKPFTGFYQNEIKAEAYQVTKSIAKIFTWFAIISILLTATGLFALVSLTVLKRTKEIALRKVMGANPGDILVLISRGYFWIFLIASAIGCYGGYSLTKLLLDLIFGVNPGIEFSTLITSIIVLFVIAAITSGIKVWQAVRANPVHKLRSE